MNAVAKVVSDDIDGSADDLANYSQAIVRVSAAFPDLVRSTWNALLLFEYSRHEPLSQVAAGQLHTHRVEVARALGLKVAP